jgi:hypothetical protein
LAGKEYAWAKAVFYVLDAPKHPGGYSERYGRLKDLKAEKKRKQLPFFEVPKYLSFDNTNQFISHCDTVIKAGGSAVMYKPNGLYKPGLSTSVKAFKVINFNSPFSS